MRGYLRCERCDWSRIYARFSVARLPQYCPACGRRVVREREPQKDTPAIARWQAIADQLGSQRRQPSKPDPSPPKPL